MGQRVRAPARAVIGERTPDGWVLRVRPEGVGRFGGALFLCVWLCGWAFGEVMVLSILLGGAYALLTGHEYRGAMKSLPPGPTLGVGAFLLVWITGWTFGGIAALGELLRLVSSEDTLTVGPAGTTIRHRRGPFAWTRTLPMGEIRNLRVAHKHHVLNLETRDKVIAFAALPNAAAATEALEALRRELHLPTTQEPGDALPEGWEETITPEGERVVVPALRTRHRQMLVLAAIAGTAWLVALALAWLATRGQDTLGAALGVSAFATVFAAGGVWLDRTRTELKIGSGQITCRRRFGKGVRELFQAETLEFTLSTDSDGDVWYKLEAVAGPPPGLAGPRRRPRRTLVRTMNDPFVPRALGAWLAARAGVPFSTP